MDIETLKREILHVFKELIGASLMHPREGKNSSYYSHLFENLVNALEDYERLETREEDQEPLDELPLKYPLNGTNYHGSSLNSVHLHHPEDQGADQNRNMKFIAEELLIKVEQLLQKVTEKSILIPRAVVNVESSLVSTYGWLEPSIF